MRTLLPLPLALLTAACWTPGPGQIDPTLYPWDQPQPANYCVVMLEQPIASGITVGGRAGMAMACKPQPLRRTN